jgi:hypothetical protein
MAGRFGITLACPPRSIELAGRDLTFCQSLGLLLDPPGDAGGHRFNYRTVVALRHHAN